MNGGSSAENHLSKRQRVQSEAIKTLICEFLCNLLNCVPEMCMPVGNKSKVYSVGAREKKRADRMSFCRQKHFDEHLTTWCRQNIIRPTTVLGIATCATGFFREFDQFYEFQLKWEISATSHLAWFALNILSYGCRFSSTGPEYLSWQFIKIILRFDSQTWDKQNDFRRLSLAAHWNNALNPIEFDAHKFHFLSYGMACVFN